MVKLNKIYTRTGDKGTTGLANGERRSKADLRVEAYGCVDETNACIGLARLHADERIDPMLARIQNDLFDLGADLATPPSEEPLGYEPLRVVAGQVAWLETAIDALNADLQPLTSFVLPGGTALSANLHLARTVCRRAERILVSLIANEAEKISPESLHYLNRLSDFLFVAARVANRNGAGDVLWVPGQNREP